MNKICRKPFEKYNEVFTKRPLELIHVDLFGPMRTKSIGGSFYFMTCIDDFSRNIKEYFLKSKSDALMWFKEYAAEVENFYNMKIKKIRSDNGTEFTNENFRDFLKKKGIIHEKTVAYTPQQNGVAERANRTLVEMVRCMLSESNLHNALWAEAVYIKNRSPTKILKSKNPYFYWYGRVPSVKHFKIFGCKAVVLNKKPGKDKLKPKGEEMIFVGYAENVEAYRF